MQLELLILGDLMFEKSFITDCEGPLTLNDNAYELANHFIENGGELFKILSSYDDYLVDIVKKEGYNAGNTLKLILPFFIAENVSNKDFVDFSKKNIYAVSDSKFLIKYLNKSMNIYIVSTSYGQYIEAVSNYMNVPFENTFYTNVDISHLKLSSDETEKINEFKELILKNPKDYDLFEDIFFNKIPTMSIYNEIKKIDVIGGHGKKLAIDKIIEKDNINKNEILYIGDSITDVEPLEFAKKHNGLSISFNGNEFPLKVAEITIVSPNAIPTALIADIYTKYDKNKVLTFIKEYNNSNDYKKLFNEYNIDDNIADMFFSVFTTDYPLIQIINKDNYENILQKSKEMRNNIRGQDIGNLG